MPPPRRGGTYALGVDGGGSKTHAVLVDGSGRIRGEGEAGSSNHLVTGLPSAVRNLRLAVAAAVLSAGCEPPVDAAWIGVAGLDGQNGIAGWESYLARGDPLASSIYLGNDADLLLSALAEAVGVVLIAGTGSHALGRDATGATARSSGWGHLIGDEGSGFDIGRQALQATMRAADGRGPQTLLLERCLEAFGVNRAEGLLPHVYRRFEKARIARLSQVVLAAAREGDAVAREIVARAARELALAALAVMRRLSFGEGPVPLALGGGLLVHERAYRMRVLRTLRRQRALRPVVVVERPAMSAARAARRLAAFQPASVVRLRRPSEVPR
jgi:glucosamine kinase